MSNRNNPTPAKVRIYGTGERGLRLSVDDVDLTNEVTSFKLVRDRNGSVSLTLGIVPGTLDVHVGARTVWMNVEVPFAPSLDEQHISGH